MRKYLEPGSIIGLIGGGYESYLLLTQAHKMGFKTRLAVVDQNDEAILAADEYVVVDNFNYENIKKVAEISDILMFETLELDNDDLVRIANEFPVIQGTELVSMAQDRYLERTFLDGININIVPFQMVVSEDDLQIGIKNIGYPCVLRPIQKGIDRQVVLNSEGDIAEAKVIIGQGAYILEASVDVKQEFTIMAAKRANGKIHVFPMINDQYQNGILKSASVFIKNDPRVEEEVQRVVAKVAQSINYIGVFGIQFIISDNKNLYVKQIVPGLAYSANVYELATGRSQFELHLRAIANWPIPEVFPLTNTSILRIMKEQKEEALELLQEKSQWKFMFHNADDSFTYEDEVGYILLSSSEEDFLRNNINNTKSWKID
ncbi:phosphoribosylglycinamide formyltransferase 2 [Companilactobacillus sp. RD055328]|uniref:ATP-grasp domain-containing protein n=1 Tax=Companilactobacillus sp. RD055328 TaxID=2916634 RepID=UPI001FC8C250|nr:ATP-grasp domain-containing protein [Companilactobacillus sp. RD055328]GKQ43134.1 phosphoribosylglycinamide formyltransferase 2 [Companilactobacillus sp. RD055328]